MLFIDHDSKNRIKELIAHAEKNKFSTPMLLEMIEGKIPPAGDDDNFVCHLQSGFRVVFTIEEHPMGWMKHISISSHGHFPSKTESDFVVKEFGFDGLKSGHIYPEGDVAINILEQYEV